MKYKWIIKIVFNRLNGTREVHPPYYVDEIIDVPELIGSRSGDIWIEHKIFKNHDDAVDYFNSYQKIEYVDLIRSEYCNKITTLN